MKNRIAKTLAVLSISTLALTGCYGNEYQERQESQKTSQITNSLEKQNLEKKRDREENPTAERYLYLYSYGQPIGYYLTIGKVSSSASQIGPENEVIRSVGGNGYILDSAKDDGTYGAGDPGIFFFTADDVMVETTFDYQISDAPLNIDVPQLYK